MLLAPVLLLGIVDTAVAAALSPRDIMPDMPSTGMGDCTSKCGVLNDIKTWCNGDDSDINNCDVNKVCTASTDTAFRECIACWKTMPEIILTPEVDNVVKDVCATKGIDVTAPPPSSCSSECSVLSSVQGSCVDQQSGCESYCTVETDDQVTKCIQCLPDSDPRKATYTDLQPKYRDSCKNIGKPIGGGGEPTCSAECGIVGSVKGYCVDQQQACEGYCSKSTNDDIAKCIACLPDSNPLKATYADMQPKYHEVCRTLGVPIEGVEPPGPPKTIEETIVEKCPTCSDVYHLRDVCVAGANPSDECKANCENENEHQSNLKDCQSCIKGIAGELKWTDDVTDHYVNEYLAAMGPRFEEMCKNKEVPVPPTPEPPVTNVPNPNMPNPNMPNPNTPNPNTPNPNKPNPVNPGSGTRTTGTTTTRGSTSTGKAGSTGAATPATVFSGVGVTLAVLGGLFGAFVIF